MDKLKKKTIELLIEWKIYMNKSISSIASFNYKTTAYCVFINESIKKKQKLEYEIEKLLVFLMKKDKKINNFFKNYVGHKQNRIRTLFYDILYKAKVCKNNNNYNRNIYEKYDELLKCLE